MVVTTDEIGILLNRTVAIVTTGHDVGDARLHKTAAALRRAGFDVHVRGLGDARRAPEGCSVSTAVSAGKAMRAFRAVVWPLRVRADVLLTIDPDTSLGAFVAARLRRVPWVADVHEDYRAVLLDRSWVPRPMLSLLQTAVSALNWLIAHADLVLVADEHVPPRRARHRYVMRNEPDLAMLRTTVDGVQGDGWRAAYVGDNRRSRGLQTMVEAVAATALDAQPWKLDIVGPTSSNDREWLLARLRDPDCSAIRWHGRQSPKQSWEIAGGADLGFCLLAKTPAFTEAMPSKIYEYMASGMPTVASPLPRVAELLHRTGAGVLVESLDETVAALRRYATDTEWRDGLIAAARAAGAVSAGRRNTYDRAAKLIATLPASR